MRRPRGVRRRADDRDPRPSSAAARGCRRRRAAGRKPVLLEVAISVATRSRSASRVAMVIVLPCPSRLSPADRGTTVPTDASRTGNCLQPMHAMAVACRTLRRARPAAEGCPGSEEESRCSVSTPAGRARRGVGHPASAACSSTGPRPPLRRGSRAAAARVRRGAVAEARPRPPARPRPKRCNTDWKACVAFDTGGLGDKGFNDLAKKGLEDAEGAWLPDGLQRGAGRDGLRAQHPDASSTRAASRSSRSASTRPRRRSTRPRPTRTSRSRRSTRPGTRRDQRARRRPPRTSPAWTSRSTRRRCSPGYLAAGFSKSGKIGTYGGQQFPGVTRFMDGMYAGIKYLQREEGRERPAPRLGRGQADRHLRRRRQPLG